MIQISDYPLFEQVWFLQRRCPYTRQNICVYACSFDFCVHNTAMSFLGCQWSGILIAYKRPVSSLYL